MNALKISIVIIFFVVMGYIVFKMTQVQVPPPPTIVPIPDEQMNGIIVTVPEGLTVEDALRQGKILEIYW